MARRFQTRDFRCARNDAAFFIQIRTGENADDPGHSFGGIRSDTVDFGMGIWAAKKQRVKHPGQRDIIHVRSDAFDQARVLDALHGLADVVFGRGHGGRVTKLQELHGCMVATLHCYKVTNSLIERGDVGGRATM